MKAIGKFYAEGSSDCKEVELWVKGDDQNTQYKQCLVISTLSGQVLFEGSPADVKVEDKLGKLPRQICIADVGLLVLEANDALDDWLDGSNASGLVAKLENNLATVLLSALLVPLCLFGLFKYALPNAAIVFAEHVPDGAVELASKQTIYVLEKSIFDPSELEQDTQDQFQTYWMEIAHKLPLEHPVKPINFRASFIGPNALALPDGSVFITDDLFELFDNDFELLAAVMLHEVGHVEYRHSMRMIAESLAVTVALSYIFGDVSGIFELLGGVSSSVLHNQFTQQNEWEADNFAIDNLQAVGLPLDAFSKAMEKFAELTGEEMTGQEYLQSHPLTSQRIENARRLLAEEQ